MSADPKMHVVYTRLKQVGMDEWVTHPRVLAVTPQTTVQDILDWHDLADKDLTPIFHLVVER